MDGSVDGSSLPSDMQALDNQSPAQPSLNSNVSSPISPKKFSSLEEVSRCSFPGQSWTTSSIETSGDQILVNLDWPCSAGNDLKPIPSSPSSPSRDLVHHESPAAPLPNLNPFSPPLPNETLADHYLTLLSLPADNNQFLLHDPFEPISVIMPEPDVSAFDRHFLQLEKERISLSLFSPEEDDPEEHRPLSDMQWCSQKKDGIAYPPRSYDSEDEIVECKPWTQSQWNAKESSWSKVRESKEVIPTGVGSGISNLGNTCFMNSILQCFTHTVPLVEALQTYNHPMPCNREGFCAICILRDHIQLSLHSSGGVISPSRFVDNLNKFSPFFQKYQQEDAHEFLQSILDKLERCCLDSEKKDDSLSSHDINIVEQVFGGRLLSRLQCCNCGHYSDTYEPSIGLSLEIEEVDALQNALLSFTSVEKLEDPETKFKCENCKETVLKEKQLMVDRAPSVATFHLKRFKNHGIFVDKIYKHVKFPLELDLQPYTSSEEVELKYYLYAFVVHVGKSLTDGHYFCYVRSSLNTWHKLDDSQVTRVEEDFVLSQDAYILFYARQETPWFSTIFEGIKPRLEANTNLLPKSVMDSVKNDFNSDNRIGDNENYEVNKSSDNEMTAKLKKWSQLIEMSNAAGVVSAKNSYKSNQNKDDVPMIHASSALMDSEYEISQNVLSLKKNNWDQRGTKVSRKNSSPSTLPGSESSGVPREHQEAVYCIPRDHLKLEKEGSRKRPSGKVPLDMNTSLALSCPEKHIPGSRATMLSTDMEVGQDGDPNKRKKLHATPCKTSSPPSEEKPTNGDEVDIEFLILKFDKANKGRKWRRIEEVGSYFRFEKLVFVGCELIAYNEERKKGDSLSFSFSANERRGDGKFLSEACLKVYSMAVWEDEEGDWVLGTERKE
ncbi:ubiquitin carboxyl-terminal hydrolase 21-like [Carica papaya]|uniref:ubiquitin carboxyl-terminal hydrolase 21-like n=1 Tax=Carica papaya TaxID=3649 RepID=UPI000B8C7618|nr:ubiquitin carboxyl-terminal hydrolase 21-like [Carica papaya]